MKQMLTLPCVALALLAVLAPAPAAHAKAAFASKAEMIARSEAIAAVTVEEVAEVEVKGQHWTYRQRATARVHEVVKGTLPQAIDLFGEETFICARCTFGVGRHLVFLKRDGDLWVGSNWHLSVRPITGQNVEWYVAEKGIEVKVMPLADVLNEVRTISTKKK